MASLSVNRSKRAAASQALLDELTKFLEEQAPDRLPHVVIDLGGRVSARAAKAQGMRPPCRLLGPRDYLERLPALAQEAGSTGLRVLALHPDPGTAGAMLLALAGRGLLGAAPVRPVALGPSGSHATMHVLSHCDYRIRPASDSDSPRLAELETLCWQHTRTSTQRIRARLRDHAEGQFVLERDGAVLGVVYSQRIQDPEQLARHSAATVHRLHDPAGPVVQLLALNVDPAAQNLNLGDQLLEFMLQRCSMLPGVERVVGVTICKSFDAACAGPFDEYIRRDGAGQDPVLAFHRAHGASVVRSIPNYRPQDLANQGHGVLVSYDILNRVPQRGAPFVADAAGKGERTALDAGQVRQFVQAQALRLLGGRSAAFGTDVPVMEMGLDSADLLTMQLQLEQEYGLALPGAFFFQYNTLDKVVAFLCAGRAPAEACPDPVRPPLEDEVPADDTGASCADRDIAVIGMACRLPGGIDTPDALWRLLSTAGSAIDAYPRSRGGWPSAADYPGIDRGGFVADAERFDAGFFRMSPSEARVTDPQQRMLLELAWTCLEDAGILPADLKGKEVGVFVGASNSDYSRLVQEARIATEAHQATGGSLAILANRLSYFFDLSGPSMLIDTACSSSLVALHAAIGAIRAGECPAALVGGVNLICHPDLSIAYHKAGMLAPDGQCKVFDAQANGYVRAEGGVVMLLKPLRQALRDRDRIHAVIKGSAINHGGLAGGLTVPNPQKQGELLAAAWKNAGIHPRQLDYIEAHGTGTSLGDPIEVQGIRQALLASGASHACGLGSIKSNLGHLESAAGITGLLKVILAMRAGELPPSIHFGTLNPKIGLDGTGLYVVAGKQPWPGGRPRTAGVSSFGSGGANGHVVVQQYEQAAPDGACAQTGEGYLFVLSAASQERLRAYATGIANWLDRSVTEREFADMIHTWQAGRVGMRHRLAIKAADAPDLRARLLHWLREPDAAQDTWQGIAGKGAAPRRAGGARALRELAAAWTSGAEIDWHALYLDAGAGAVPPRRAGLPTYPFGGERYWVDGAAGHEAATTLPRDAEPDALFAVPTWVGASLPPASGPAATTRHHVVLCELPEVDGARLAQALGLEDVVQLQRSTPGEGIAQRYVRYALACFERLRAIRSDKQAGRVLFQVVVPAGGQGALFAGLTGLLKTAMQEAPQLVCQLLLAEHDVGTQALAERLERERAHPGDAVVRYAHGVREVQSWEPIPAQEAAPVLAPFRDNGVYLITGGLGGLGRLFARHLLGCCSRPTIILTGRAPLSGGRQAHFDALCALGSGTGASIEYRQVDLEDGAQVGRLVASIRAGAGRLDGVVHSAGMIADNFILKKSGAEFAQVLGPKVAGLVHLDEASKDMELDFMALFSSVASVLGNAGQADYAAANGFMDEFAAWRNALEQAGTRRGRTVAFNWPLWKDGGMSVDESSLELMRATTGMVPMRAETGMRMFRLGLASSWSQGVVLEGDAGAIRATLARCSRGGAELAAQSAAPARLAQETLARLKQLFGEVMNLQAGRIDGDEPLSTYGIDSIFINKLNVKLAQVFGKVSRTLFFEYATLAELADHLAQAHEAQCLAWTGLDAQQPAQRAAAAGSGQAAPAAAAAPVREAAQPGRHKQIAIIGMAGLYPQAPDLETFWENLKTGTDSVTEIPADRWALEGFYEPDPQRAVEQGMSYSKWCGALEHFADFDPLFFNMSPREAMNIDPQERLFLQESWRAMEDAGYTRGDLKKKFRQRVGVFAGITKAGYNLYASGCAGRDDGFFPFTSFSSAANRVSYFLDLCGPSMPVDTMCSSSLTAIHEACEHISRGECDLAFAGGVNLYLHPATYTWLSSQQMLSRDGRCKSFGAGGNGYVPGEGVGVVLLKPLANAIADGDNIRGVIIATHVNHGGKTNGYTVPSPRAQAELIRGALDKAGIKATDVSYIEAHGTGTELGDPIELSGLQQAFSRDSQETGYCRIGSLKSNIGHLESAAGVAGLAKVVLQMQHRQIVPSLHAERLNPNLDFAATAFTLNRTLSPWEAPAGGAPRIAGISSFGAGGANAHILVQEYVAPAARAGGTGAAVPVPLSARTAGQLEGRMRDLLRFLENAREPIELADLAYTLQVGREAMEVRAGFLADSTDALKEKLRACLGGAADGETVFMGQVAAHKETLRLLQDEDFADTLEKWIARGKHAKLLDLWVKGLEFDWRRLYGEDTPRRVALPTYPFARQRYWIDTLASRPAASAAGAALYPLLHRNTSDLSRQRYTSVFSGDEFFLNDHKVGGKRILPAVACLEMARAAVELAAPATLKSSVLELRNTTWARPVAVAGATTVGIALSLDGAAGDEIAFAVETEAGTHCEGVAAYRHEAAPTPLDLVALRSQMRAADLPAEGVYQRFAAMGIDYGPAHRAIATVHRGERQLLAELRLPAALEAGIGEYLLHPSMMDCALQASIGLLGDTSGSALLPFALESLRVHAGCARTMFSWVRLAAGSLPGDGTVKFDVDLCDEQGRVCVQMRGFSSRPMAAAPQAAGRPALHALVPMWNPVRPEMLERAPDEKVLLLGDDAAHLAWVRQACPGAASLALPEGADIETIALGLRAQPFDRLLWVAPDAGNEAACAAAGDIVAQQQRGVLAVFRVAKALIKLGFADRPLRWTLVTCNTQQVRPGERVAPAHAGVCGMIGSLAKEHPEWRLTLVDTDALAALDPAECLRLPANEQGDVLARRAGAWFSQGLVRLTELAQAQSAYRQGGVYLVIGGAGGIGEVWSRHMAEHFGAQLVWIGRQPLSAAIEDKIRSVSRRGPAPLYFQADATDAGALEQALAAILRVCPRIHGVVHSAIVLRDQSVALMDEETFRAGLAAKVDVSVNLDKVFGGCDLDFMLYFSSLIAFTKAAGQSNYSAGCTFKDSFALAQAQARPYPVKIMNWGYWGSVGIVTSDYYNKRMQQLGVGSIEPDEAMSALQGLAAGRIHQMALMKTLDDSAVDAISLPERVTVFPAAAPEALAEGPDMGAPLSELEKHSLPAGMLSLAGQLLESCLASLGMLDGARQPANPLHARWLAACAGYLREQGLAKGPGRAPEILWTQWESRKGDWEANPEWRAQSILLERCLRALPEVLLGTRAATDVMFPDSSMALVEGIYRGNALSDFYNRALAATLAECIARKLARGEREPLRILEIGAGTGGTTSAVLPVLQRFAGSIAEYCYTDLSKAFLIHAEEQYQPRFPALRTALFDVSRPVAPQGIPMGHFDFAIATNCLHATSNIRETLRNAKAALKSQGVLLLNEMSVWSLFNHLTFGLLDGWWLYEDEALRLPGSPGLAPQAWRQVLHEEGFGPVVFVAPDTHALGQQVIAAASDGVVRQRTAAPPAAALVRAEPAPAMRAAQPAPAGSLRDKTLAHVRELVATTLRLDVAQIDPGRPLADYGLDSILVVGLTTRLRKQFSGITSTLFFEVQHIDGLAEHLLRNNGQELETLFGSAPPAQAPAPSPARAMAPAAPTAAPAEPARKVEVAIVGLGGRYPRSPDMDAFWANLASGTNCVSEIPQERWRWEEFFDPEKGKPGKIYSRWGGFLDDIDKFDPLFFKLSPKEAKGIDPQERLFLETCYHAIEDAGYTPSSLADADKVGVFAGVMNARYTTQPLHYSVANRVSFLLNFQGPSMAVDTACSASLTAVHLAVESIMNGSCECAIAGGVNLILDPVHYLELSALTMLSAGSECKSFGAHADGFVDAEGVGAVVLKPLDKARRDGDHIYGVVKGSAVNSGGRTNGYTVPNPKAQAAVVAKALERAGLQAWQLSYVEAHGTGTALGDPIEIAGLSSAFRQSTQDAQFCAIGSLKSNIGHCESAAGIAGLTKVLLQMKHGQLVPSLHAQAVNPEIDFARTPFRVQRELEQWKRPQRVVDGVMRELPRIAGISSFGAGGANAHLIVEEYLPAAPRSGGASGPAAVPLSARTLEQLRHKAADLARHIARARQAGQALDLGSLAYTLQVGREAMEERLGLLAGSVDELEQQLRAFADGAALDDCWYGKVKRYGDSAALPGPSTHAGADARQLAAILAWWVQGGMPDWKRLYAGEPPARVSLPAYPFARERYWRERSDAQAASSQELRGAAQLHPLVHANVSDIRQQRYRSSFDAKSQLLLGHRMLIDGAAGYDVAPASVLLEMARAAAIDALSLDADAAVRLERVAFAEPVIFRPGMSVEIAVFAAGDGGIDVEIYSPAEGNGEEIIHCQGHAMAIASPARDFVELERLQRQLPAVRDGGAHYELLASQSGLRYGRAYRALAAVRTGPAQCLAELRLPADADGAQAMLAVLLDGALQAAFDLAPAGSQPSLPLAIESVELLGPCAPEMAAWVRLAGAGSAQAGTVRLDIDLCDRQGSVRASLRGLAYEAGPFADSRSADSRGATAVTLADPQKHAGGTAAPARSRKVSLDPTA